MLIQDFFLTGPIPADAIVGTYSPSLVILSYLIITFCAYVSLSMANRLRDANSTKLNNILWLGASFVMGAGIWSMHFVGMFAYQIPISFTFSLPWTVTSIIVDVAASAFGFYFIKTKRLNYFNIGFAGLLGGLTIGSMHYLAMEAVTKNYIIQYIPHYVILSFCGAILAAEATLWAALKSSGTPTKTKHLFRIASALALGLAICVLHYTGMLAAVLIPADSAVTDGVEKWAISLFILNILVFSVAILSIYRSIERAYVAIQETFQHLGEGIFITDEDGKIESINTKGMKIFDYDMAELTTMSLTQLLDSKSRHLLKKAMHSILNQEERSAADKEPMEMVGVCKNGKTFPLEVSLSFMVLNDNIKFIAITRNISKRKKIEEGYSITSAIVHSAEDPIIGKDLNGIILSWNLGAQKLYGYTPEEAIGKSILMVFPENKRHEFDLIIQKIRQGEGFKLEDTIRVTKNGRIIPVSLTVSPMKNAQGEVIGAASVVKDISHQKILLQALSKKNLELQTANRTKDTFLTTMSHELRTPLNAILGFTGTLLMKLPGPLNTDQEKQLLTIKKSAKHLLSLISDILDLAKIEAGKIDINLELVNAEEIIQEVANTLAPLADSKELALKVSIPPGTRIMLRVDRRALTQILINLANNAIKFTDKGLVEIGLETIKFDDKEFVAIHVVDTGIGIKPEDYPKVFVPFEQIREEGKLAKGTGLGLHLSQKLAALMGTKLQFESEYGKGSRFTLILPVEVPVENEERVNTNNENTNSNH